jgi:aspartate carbamoyltransferase catalytic subunit
MGRTLAWRDDAVGKPDVKRHLRRLVTGIELIGHDLISINDLTNNQIYKLFEVADILGEWNRSKIDLVREKVLCTLFYQPSTRTRMSFETAMYRLGGCVVNESTPLISSSAAKEESLADTMKVVSQYANVIVLRHPDDTEARSAVATADSPVINGGFGKWEHPTQALLDLYTLWHTFRRIEGVRVCIASPDLAGARTGHSMAYALGRLGAKVFFASQRGKGIPPEVIGALQASGAEYEEVVDLTQASFNEYIETMDLVYLPGCSAPKGAEAEDYKRIMDDFFVRFGTLDRIKHATGRVIRVTHTLPRRAGEMDLQIDASDHQLYFAAILHSVSIRMALIASVLGV